MVLERGRQEGSLGTIASGFRFYDTTNILKMPPASKEGICLFRTFMAGGVATVAVGNAVRCLEKELKGAGIELASEFEEAENEMNVSLFREEFISDASSRIREESEKLGYRMDLMPKFIDFDKCVGCGKCILGCKYGAKWSPTTYLKEAVDEGVDILYGSKVSSLIVENGCAKGVNIMSQKSGRDKRYAEKVILSAGGIETSVILKKLGIENAGSNFFMDICVNAYGINEKCSQNTESPMPLVCCEHKDTKGFVLSPFISPHPLCRAAEYGPFSPNIFRYPMKKITGIMTMIADEPIGTVDAKGDFSKPITVQDKKRLDAGVAASKEILIKTGIDSKTIRITKIQGAHPGGTVSIGKVVDGNLQAIDVKNLFVCDSSVLPASPGLPPILTIVALAKRLAKKLCL